MSVADHPVFQGDGKAGQYVCPARRPVPAVMQTGAQAGSAAVWHLDCVHRRGHLGPHVDIRGRSWESVAP